MIDAHNKILELIEQLLKNYIPTLPKVDGITYKRHDNFLDTSGMNDGYTIKICDVLLDGNVVDTILFYKHAYGGGESIALERRHTKPTEKELKRIADSCRKKFKSIFSKEQILKEFKAVEDIDKSFKKIKRNDYGSYHREGEEAACYKMDINEENALIISIGKMDKGAMLADAGMSRVNFYNKHNIRSVYIVKSYIFNNYTGVASRHASIHASKILPSSVRNSIKKYLEHFSA